MEVAIIGAGFSGLSAAYKLTKQGHRVVVFEQASEPGGLAAGFKDSNWSWTLEHHYHHLFTSDSSILDLAQELGHPVHFIRPITATYLKGRIEQLDSPLSLLRFNGLPLVDRFRTGLGLALLKFNPFWKPFEYITAKKFITLVLGTKSWELLWEPLFVGKFGQYTDQISAAWFWSRIYKRSSKLGYPDGGFLSLAKTIERAAIAQGAMFNYATTVTKIKPLASKKIQIVTSSGEAHAYDKVICTLPIHLLKKICPAAITKDYALKGLGAVNLILSLKKSFFKNDTYWLNINDRSMPFLAVVEHTNFMNKSHYNGDRLLYVGNYLDQSHSYFSLNDKELLQKYVSSLRKLNPDFRLDDVQKSWVFKANFAQPIVTTRYSSNIPPMLTQIPNLYLANMQQVYPWDRGTNYAVELGNKVAKLCIEKSDQ